MTLLTMMLVAAAPAWGPALDTSWAGGERPT